MVANIQHLHQNGDGTVCLTPIQVPSVGGSSAPVQKYHLLRAAAPVTAIKYEGAEGVAVVPMETATTTTTVTKAEVTTASSGGGGGQMSMGLASLIDVIQSEIKDEELEGENGGGMAENDCNNNDGLERRLVAAGGGGGVRPKVRVVVKMK